MLLLDLSPEFKYELDGIFSSHPNLSAEKLIEFTVKPIERSEQIGYSDPVEYMMCNYGEAPTGDVLCHGETRTVTDTYRLKSEAAECIREFYLTKGNGTFVEFCKYLNTHCQLSRNFKNVNHLKMHSELPSRYLSKEIRRELLKHTFAYKPRFWRALDIWNEPKLIVQPDRRKASFYMYKHPEHTMLDFSYYLI